MNDNNLHGDDFEFRRARRTPDTRQQTPRATRTTKHKKKRSGPGSIGGVHQRRNKHWGW